MKLDAGPRQAVKIDHRFKRAFPRQSVKRPEYYYVTAALFGLFDQTGELGPLYPAGFLLVKFRYDRPGAGRAIGKYFVPLRGELLMIG